MRINRQLVIDEEVVAQQRCRDVSDEEAVSELFWKAAVNLNPALSVDGDAFLRLLWRAPTMRSEP